MNSKDKSKNYRSKLNSRNRQLCCNRVFKSSRNNTNNNQWQLHHQQLFINHWFNNFKCQLRYHNNNKKWWCQERNLNKALKKNPRHSKNQKNQCLMIMSRKMKRKMLILKKTIKKIVRTRSSLKMKREWCITIKKWKSAKNKWLKTSTIAPKYLKITTNSNSINYPNLETDNINTTMVSTNSRKALIHLNPEAEAGAETILKISYSRDNKVSMPVRCRVRLRIRRWCIIRMILHCLSIKNLWYDLETILKILWLSSNISNYHSSSSSSSSKDLNNRTMSSWWCNRFPSRKCSKT